MGGYADEKCVLQTIEDDCFYQLLRNIKKMLSTEQQEKLLGNLLKKPQNMYCADCNSKSPCWASLDFGVFVCINCAGAHRALGPSITRVKSTKLDQWNKDWLWHMQLGNQSINKFYEDSPDAVSSFKPGVNSSSAELRKYISSKYVKRMYAKSGEDDPLTRLKNGTYQQPVTKKVEPVKVEKVQAKEQKKVVEAKKETKTKKNIDLLGEEIVHKKEEKKMNLFEEHPENVKAPTYNKDHFNSFSGIGTKNSHIDFESLWNESKEKSKPQIHHFKEFNNFNFDQKPPQQQQSPFPLQFPTNNYAAPPYSGYPQQVTMNINMNMYPNVMNINVNGSQNVPHSQSLNQVKLSEPITLEAKTLGEKKEKIEEKKSWVDDWK